jgi:hypothetical protein
VTARLEELEELEEMDAAEMELWPGQRSGVRR